MCIFLRFHDVDNYLDHEKTVPKYVTYNTQSENYSTHTAEPASDFLHKVITIRYSNRHSPKVLSGIEILFISDPKDTIQKHYLEQPKSKLCRKLIRRFHESPHHKTSNTFGYQTHLKICEFILLSYKFFLQISIFYSISKLFIVVPLIFINSLRMTFWNKKPYPIFDW